MRLYQYHSFNQLHGTVPSFLADISARGVELAPWERGVPSPSSTAMQQLELKVSVCLQKRGMDKERIVKYRAHLGHE